MALGTLWDGEGYEADEIALDEESACKISPVGEMLMLRLWLGSGSQPYSSSEGYCFGVEVRGARVACL